MMRMGTILIRLEKLTVDDLQDEQDFRLEDVVTEDCMEQIKPKQFPLVESEYYA